MPILSPEAPKQVTLVDQFGRPIEHAPAAETEPAKPAAPTSPPLTEKEVTEESSEATEAVANEGVIDAVLADAPEVTQAIKAAAVDEGIPAAELDQLALESKRFLELNPSRIEGATEAQKIGIEKLLLELIAAEGLDAAILNAAVRKIKIVDQLPNKPAGYEHIKGAVMGMACVDGSILFRKDFDPDNPRHAHFLRHEIGHQIATLIPRGEYQKQVEGRSTNMDTKYSLQAKANAAAFIEERLAEDLADHLHSRSSLEFAAHRLQRLDDKALAAEFGGDETAAKAVRTQIQNELKTGSTNWQTDPKLEPFRRFAKESEGLFGFFNQKLGEQKGKPPETVLKLFNDRRSPSRNDWFSSGGYFDDAGASNYGQPSKSLWEMLFRAVKLFFTNQE